MGKFTPRGTLGSLAMSGVSLMVTTWGKGVLLASTEYRLGTQDGLGRPGMVWSETAVSLRLCVSPPPRGWDKGQCFSPHPPARNLCQN